LNTEKTPVAATLTLALALSLPLKKAKSMAELLLKLGATSSQADLNGCTVFHRYVDKAEAAMIDTLWENDKAAVKTALNHLIIGSSYWTSSATAPLHTAIGNNDTVLVLKLLNAGANPTIDFDMWLKVAKYSSIENRLGSYEDNMKMYNRTVEQPLMVALKSCPDPEVALRLLEKDADVNCMTPISYQILTDTWQRRYNKGQTALDVVRDQLSELRAYTGENPTIEKPEKPLQLEECIRSFEEGTYQHFIVSAAIKAQLKLFESSTKTYENSIKVFEGIKGIPEKEEAIKDAIKQLEQVEKLIVKKGGKPFYELHPDIEGPTTNASKQDPAKQNANKPYTYNFTFSNVTDVTNARKKAYIEL
jgi:hypothetical protein